MFYLVLLLFITLYIAAFAVVCRVYKKELAVLKAVLQADMTTIEAAFIGVKDIVVSPSESVYLLDPTSERWCHITPFVKLIAQMTINTAKDLGIWPAGFQHIFIATADLTPPICGRACRGEYPAFVIGQLHLRGGAPISIAETIVHEIAHLIAGADTGSLNHNEHWREIFERLSVNLAYLVTLGQFKNGI